jgi:hypothetical protein
MSIFDDLPPTVRVGPHDIILREMSEKDAEEDFGHFKSSELAIGLNKEYPTGSMAVDTVLHELLHVAWFITLRADESATEEKACCALATILTQIVRDNPEFVKWMQLTVTR